MFVKLNSGRRWAAAWGELRGSEGDHLTVNHGLRGEMTFSEFCALVCRRSIAIRGLKFASVVGPILIAINYGDAILAHELTTGSYLKMGLTVLVPYAVSVLSSAGAVLSDEGARAQKEGSRPPIRG